MANNVQLSATVRTNLLTLQATAKLQGTVEGRLSSGKKVNSSLDDAVAFFQAKTLTDRAADITRKKNEVDQAISALKVASNATDSIDSLLSQIKGLLQTAKTSDAATRASIGTQIDTLGAQLNVLVTDATYQGVNLINTTLTARLTVNLSNLTTSQFNLDGQDAQVSNLFTNSTGVLSVAGSLLATNLLDNDATGSAFSTISAAGNSILDAAITAIDAAISRNRSIASTLGTNVAFLQTRLDFNSQYANTLTEGSDKLTLADTNEEGANLVALQTRQQLALQALNFAGQAQQAVLKLFQ